MEPSKAHGRYPSNTMTSIPGSLEDITTYPNNKSRNGSRASVNSLSSISRRKFEPTGSMELLTPEVAGLNGEDYDLGLNLEDFGSDSDLNSEDYWDSEDEEHTDEDIADTSSNNNNKKNGNIKHSYGQDSCLPDVQDASQMGKELVPIANDDDIEVDSEEERDIMKEIRWEIQNKMREELQDELNVYQKKIEYLEKEAAGEVPNSQREGGEEVKVMDPKLKEAILKMKKLDRILAKKVKREREVKRDRILLQRRLREELEQIKPEGRDDIKEVKVNTERFLMLALPPSHNEGVEITEEEASPVTPVFHTQLNEEEFGDRLKSNANRKSNLSSKTEGQSHRSSDRSSCSSAHGENEEDDVKLRGKKRDKKKKSKNFIKRNIQLASDADNPIAMTDDEKKRINDLLGDLDNIPDIPEEGLVQTTAWASDQDNPFQIVLQPGEGFLPERGERDTLQHIDHRLRTLLPPEEFQSLCGSQSTLDRQNVLLTRTTMHSDVEFDRIGERALREQKDERDIQTRLKWIEDELSLLQNPMEIEIESPRLSEDALHHLIDQCVTSLSRSRLDDFDEDVTPNSDYPSSRLSILENPPKLSEDVLQKLLEDARSTASSFRLSTDREGINDARNHQFTKELGIEPISKETWNVILSHDATASDEEEETTPIPTREQDEEHSMSRRTPVNLRNDTPLSMQSFRDSEIYEDRQSRASEGRQSRTPFLPEINRTPSLVAQGSSVGARPLYDSINSVDVPLSAIGTGASDKQRTDNGLSYIDQKKIQMDATLNPRPPTSDKPLTPGQNSRSRTTTPAQSSL